MRFVPAQIFKWCGNNAYGFIMTVIGVMALVVYASSQINANSCIRNTYNESRNGKVSLSQINICRNMHGLSRLTKEEVKEGKKYPAYLKDMH